MHLAVSLQVVDRAGRWLLQRRAASKAVFADTWANSCCTHPGEGEDLEASVTRRLREEVGLNVAGVLSAGVFVYRAADPVSGLVEHEVDHVFVTVTDTAETAINPEEVSEIVWLTYSEAVHLLASDRGAPWACEVLRLSRAALEKR